MPKTIFYHTVQEFTTAIKPFTHFNSDSPQPVMYFCFVCQRQSIITVEPRHDNSQPVACPHCGDQQPIVFIPIPTQMVRVDEHHALTLYLN